mgnify:CR=1 FL=1
MRQPAIGRLLFGRARAIPPGTEHLYKFELRYSDGRGCFSGKKCSHLANGSLSQLNDTSDRNLLAMYFCAKFCKCSQSWTI